MALYLVEPIHLLFRAVWLVFVWAWYDSFHNSLNFAHPGLVFFIEHLLLVPKLLVDIGLLVNTLHCWLKLVNSVSHLKLVFEMLGFISIGSVIMFSAQVFEFLCFVDLCLQQFLIVLLNISDILWIMAIVAEQILINSIFDRDHSHQILFRNHYHAIGWHRASRFMLLGILKKLLHLFE